LASRFQAVPEEKGRVGPRLNGSSSNNGVSAPQPVGRAFYTLLEADHSPPGFAITCPWTFWTLIYDNWYPQLKRSPGRGFKPTGAGTIKVSSRPNQQLPRRDDRSPHRARRSAASHSLGHRMDGVSPAAPGIFLLKWTLEAGSFFWLSTLICHLDPLKYTFIVSCGYKRVPCPLSSFPVSSSLYAPPLSETTGKRRAVPFVGRGSSHGEQSRFPWKKSYAAPQHLLLAPSFIPAIPALQCTI